jgi:autotransporter translocation and assembly factor TamB
MPGGTFEADVQVQHLLLLPHVRVIAPALGVVDGEVAFRLSLRGTLTHPQGEGVLHVTSLRWQQHTLGEVHSQLRADGTAMGVDLHWRDQKRELLHLYGDVALDARQELALQLQAAAVDLQVLPAFSAAVAQSAGTLQLDLRLAGTLQQPQAYGTLRLDDGVLQLAATGVQCKTIQIQMVCTGQRVELTRLHAESGDGSLDLTGWAESAQLTLQWLDLILQMHQFTLMHTPHLEAVASAVVTLRGSLEEMVATGTVTVPRARPVAWQDRRWIGSSPTLATDGGRRVRFGATKDDG